MQKNDIITVEIESVSGDGSGVARFQGQVIFVPFSAVGDKVEVVIIKCAKSYAVGKVVKILSPSRTRKETDCEVFGKCGGCVFRHIDIKEEERIKTENVKSAMKKIGHIDVDVCDCVTPLEFSYRNKAQLPVSEDEKGLHCGFYASHSHRIIDKSIDCKTAPKVFGEISSYILSFMKREGISGYNEESSKGIVRHLYYRINARDEVMVCIVTSTRFLISKLIEDKLIKELCDNFPSIVSIFINYNPESTNVVLGRDFRLIFGEEYFEDEILGVKLKMSPDSFFQVNRKGADLLYKTAFSLLDKGHYENVYDLYCGIGSIGITLFSEMKKGTIGATAHRLLGIEIVEKAVECAKVNAMENGIDKAEFVACDSGEITKSGLFDKYPPSLVILDPPRKGTTTHLLDFLVEREVENILYISCDPATLARDMGYLYSKGYTSSSVHPINMFTGTKHCEAVCALHRKASQ
ncbi:MAG: 23S rRNA (uracil(1939)-C(5))-methyltransferase RlmD [Ruminococcaceae bacterium]|nr:23S rRNA (uracil(1939)-C(5))-methyltransferase RlmD [Oscillospiraceae bacterium]